MITLSNQFNEVINRNKCVAAFEMYQTEFDVEMNYSRLTRSYGVYVFIYKNHRSQTDIYQDYQKVLAIAKKLDIEHVNEDSVKRNIEDESEDLLIIWFEVQ